MFLDVASGRDLDALANVCGLRRIVESDAELRARLLAINGLHEARRCSTFHLDMAVRDYVQNQIPLSVDVDQCLRRLTSRWIRDWLCGLSFFARLVFWFRLWRSVKR